MKRLVAILAVAIGALAFSASAANAEVYWKQMGGTDLPGAGQLVTEPQQMIVYKPNSAGQVCSGCGWRLVNLKWENWGGSTAVGTGNAVPMGGPGTCGYPPEGCSYPYKKAEVYLRKIQSYCGQERYMRVGTVVDGFGVQYPKVLCDGSIYIKPRPKPKPRLKRITARSVFNKTAHEGGRLKLFEKQSLRCYRATRLRFRCRGRWIERLNINGDRYSYRAKGNGWVKRSGNSFVCKIRFIYRISTPEETFYSPPDIEWGFYVVR